MPNAYAGPAQGAAPKGSGWQMAMVAVELAALFAAANLPTPLYVIYRQKFHFSEITLTLAFAVYMAGALFSMILLGRLSDQLGRRPISYLGVGLTVLATLLFLLVGDTAMLFVARLLSGFSIGMVAAAGTAWVAELQPQGDEQAAALVSAGANVAGLGVGPLLAGILAQYAPWPLKTPYLVFLAGLAVITLLTLQVEETVEDRKGLRELSLTPRMGVPGDILPEFVSPAVTAFVTFALMGFYSAVTPSLVGETLKISNHAVGGAAVFAFFAAGVAALVATRRLKSRTAMLAGLVLLAPAVLLLAAAQGARSAWLLALATLIGGASVALGYRGALQVVNKIAPEDRRAEVVASFLACCYAGVSVPTVGVGIISQIWGLTAASAVLAGVLCALALAALVAGLRSAPKD